MIKAISSANLSWSKLFKNVSIRILTLQKRGYYLLLEQLIVVILKFLDQVVIIKEFLDSTVFLLEQRVHGGTTLRAAIVLPKVTV